MNRFLDFRAAECAKFNGNSEELTLGDVTTVNLTKIEVGMKDDKKESQTKGPIFRVVYKLM